MSVRLAHDAIELCQLIRPDTWIPVHYEGWAHFHEGARTIERSRAPEHVRNSVRWLTRGVPIDIAA